MTVGDQDQCGVPCAVSTDRRSRLDQCRDLLFRQVFAASAYYTESLLDGDYKTDGEQERAPDRPVGRRAIRSVRAARLRRSAAADLSVAVRTGTGSRFQPPRPSHPGLVCPANRLLQGQARFLPLQLGGCTGGLYVRPGPLFQRSVVSRSIHYQTRTLCPAYNDRGVVRLPPVGGGFPHATRTTGRPNRSARCHARVHRRRTHRLAKRAQDCPARLHDIADAYQRGVVRRARAFGRPARRHAGRIRTEGALPATGTRRHIVGVGGSQAGRQELQMASDGERTREACQAGTVVSDRQDVAAETWDLATQSALLRESGELLHGVRSAPTQGRANTSILAVLRLAALPATHRQSRRRLELSHEAARRREQGADRPALRCRAGNAAGRAAAVAL